MRGFGEGCAVQLRAAEMGWGMGSDVPVFGGDEVLDEFDHCEGFRSFLLLELYRGGCVQVAIA